MIMLNIFFLVEAGSVEGFGSSDSAMKFLEGLLGGIMYISMPVIGVVLVYAGFMFILARGNPEKITTAIHNFTYILVGIALVLGSYFIGSVFYNTLIKGILGWT